MLSLLVKPNPNTNLNQLEEFYDGLMKHISNIYHIIHTEEHTFHQDTFPTLSQIDDEMKFQYMDLLIYIHTIENTIKANSTVPLNQLKQANPISDTFSGYDAAGLYENTEKIYQDTLEKRK